MFRETLDLAADQLKDELTFIQEENHYGETIWTLPEQEVEIEIEYDDDGYILTTIQGIMSKGNSEIRYTSHLTEVTDSSHQASNGYSVTYLVWEI
jgi:hypothetical protein